MCARFLSHLLLIYAQNKSLNFGTVFTIELLGEVFCCTILKEHEARFYKSMSES